MSQQSSILQVGGAAVGVPSGGLVRLAAAELLLMVALVVISVLACGALSRSALVPTVQESIGSQPTAGADIRPFEGHEGNGANNDAGVAKGA